MTMVCFSCVFTVSKSSTYCFCVIIFVNILFIVLCSLYISFIFKSVLIWMIIHCQIFLKVEIHMYGSDRKQFMYSIPTNFKHMFKNMIICIMHSIYAQEVSLQLVKYSLLSPQILTALLIWPISYVLVVLLY